jgi:hypothetical protein
MYSAGLTSRYSLMLSEVQERNVGNTGRDSPVNREQIEHRSFNVELGFRFSRQAGRGLWVCQTRP